MLPNQIPVPPVDMVMSPHYNLILGLSVLLLSAVVVWAIIESRRTRRALPLLILAGAALMSLQECIFDVMVTVWWPETGHTPLYRMFNRSVPIWMLMAYPWYYGSIAILVYKRIREGLTTGGLWKLYAYGWLGNFLVEIPALQFPELGWGHLYVYLAESPFKVFGFPLWMAMTNALTPLFMGALVAAYDDILVGARSLITVVLVPMAMGASQLAAGWPIFLALNSDASFEVKQLATVITLALSLLCTYLLGLKFCKRPAAA